MKFRELYIKGLIAEEELKDFVEEWYDSDLRESLQEFLGVSVEEYQYFANPTQFFRVIMRNARKREYE